MAEHLNARQSIALDWLNPCYSGLSLIIMALFLLTYAPSYDRSYPFDRALVHEAYVWLAVAFMLVVALILIFPKVFLKMKGRRSIRLSAGTLAAVAAILYFAGLAQGFRALSITGGILAFIFVPIVVLCWAEELKRYPYKQVIVNMPMMLASTIALAMTSLYFPQGLVCAVCILSIIVSAICLEISAASDQPAIVADELDDETLFSRGLLERKPNAILVFVLVLLFLVGFVMGFLERPGFEGYLSVWYLFCGIGIFLVLGFFVLKADRKSFKTCFVLPVVMVAAIAVPFSAPSLFGWRMAATVFGALAIELFFFSLVVFFAAICKRPGYQVYGLSRLVLDLSNLLGNTIATFVLSRAAEDVGGYTSVALIIVSIEAIIGLGFGMGLFEGRKAGREEKTGESEPAAETPSIADLVKANCKAIQEPFGLSDRELEVLALLAQGYSNKAIQEELFIAAGTVNTHIRNIYMKLGVHSKSELIDLVTKRTR